MSQTDSFPCPTPCHGDSALINRHCYCLTVDQSLLRAQLMCQQTSADLYAEILASRPHLFSNTLVFVNPADYQRMRDVIAAIGEVTAQAEYQAALGNWNPTLALIPPDNQANWPQGVCMGYDFHLGSQGPQLIEINTNAGGLWLNTALARAQQRCCNSMQQQLASAVPVQDVETSLLAMFSEEWRRQRGHGMPRRVAIVDDQPAQQYLYPEFVLAARMFRHHGIHCDIVDAQDLLVANQQLTFQGQPIDLVYNRLTDFLLNDPIHAALRQAYEHRWTVVTPNPHNYALYADKRNLTLLSDPDWLAKLPISPATRDLLVQHIPLTRIVTPKNAADFWQQRRHWFFKPFSGYGSKAAYRGDKLTQATWQHISLGGYIAQRRVAPSERGVLIDAQQSTLKLDLRCYAYQNQLQLLAARLYQGQTTNFRTPGGGFASVFV